MSKRKKHEPRLTWGGNQEAQRQADEAYNKLRPKRTSAKARRLKKQEAVKNQKTESRKKASAGIFRGTYRDYLKSPQWAKKRQKAFRYHGRKCNICGRTENLQVDHLHYRTLFREAMTDLQILCRGCHENKHEDEKGCADPMTKEFLARMSQR